MQFLSPATPLYDNLLCVCLLLAAVKAIAAAQGSPAEGLKIVEKAKAAVSAVKVAQALDAIANMLDATADGKAAAAAAEGKPLKSVDTLTNLSAYLTLYR
jgi:hypothetical protein